MLKIMLRAGAASCYGSGPGFDQMMRLLAAPALQHWLHHYSSVRKQNTFKDGEVSDVQYSKRKRGWGKGGGVYGLIIKYD
jgi:hypothetical protein